MELVYLYLNEYGTFSRQNLNFGDRYRFEYREEDGILKVTKNPFYINNFFNDNHGYGVTNVSSIVGENGSGKSTLLKYIRDYLVEGGGGIPDKGIIIAKKDNRYIINYHLDFKLEVMHKGLNFEYELIPFSIVQKDNIEIWPIIKSFEDVSFVFLSNVFDNEYEEEYTHLYNLSTNFLIKNDLRKEKELSQQQNLQSETELHRLREVRRQIFFINDFRDSEGIPFSLPEEISLFPIVPSHRLKDIPYGKYSELVDEIFMSIDRKIDKYKNKKSQSELIRKNIMKGKLFKAIVSNYFFEEKNIKLSSPINNPTVSIQDIEGKDIFEKVRNLFHTPYFSNGFKIREILDFFEEHLSDFKFSYDLQSMNMKLDEGYVQDFITMYQKTFTFKQYLEFDWKGLSSGQKAYLNILSRLHSISDQYVTNNMRLEEEVIVLVDEGELYFHPQWQKSLLTLLIDFLPKIFQHRYIQLIVTSNSPFIVSDLPNSNIIFLKRNGNTTQVIDGLSENKLTFAANIHTLYSDSFFMDGGLIGDFAKRKINHLINRLHHSSVQEIYDDKENIESLIQIIGEPVIRKRLLSLLNEKLSLNVMSLDERISYLEKELKKLKGHNKS